MLTLEQDAREFETNANQTGLQQFLMLKRGTNPEGKNVYIYQRAHAEGQNLGKIAGFEVVVPNIKKAGTYPLPNGKSITYAEDFEEYPGASLFGKKAWFCANLQRAEERFQQLISVKVEEPEDIEPAKPKTPKVAKAPLKLLHGEFSVTELADKNRVSYPVAFNFVKDQVAAGVIKPTRTERRAVKGKETQLYAKI